MKKKLTINTLALENLKQRKKQYAIMIIGIIMAMVFSSSIVFFMSSASETLKEKNARQYGKQSDIVYGAQIGEKEYREAVDKKLINDFGLAHTIGYAYTDSKQKNLGASVCWLDDKAKEISYQIILEGNLPKNENEIAVEKSSLIRLGYKDIKIGDTVRLILDVQNGSDYLGAVEKEYTLVGIISDKKSNIEYSSSVFDEYDTLVPAFFVADNTQTEPGGKEKLSAYIDADFTNYDDEEKFNNYLTAITEDYQSNRNIINDRAFVSFDHLFSGGDYFFFVIIVLIFASCATIINAFNTNLKERKKQIGMLRAVGTTRRQIIEIFGMEALIITLICTPVSILLSYASVYILLNIISDEAIITKSILTLPIAAVINIIVVMLAALIPLFSASRITPMQAIRNISSTRKIKTKKIKTKKNFDAAKHIAKRNLKFNNSSRITVSIMLAAAIILSCFGFSAVNNVKNDFYSLPYDYYLSSHSDNGISETDMQNIAAMPYFSKVIGKKRIDAIVEYGKIDDYFRVINNNAFQNQDGTSPSSNKELADNIKNKPVNRYYEERKTNIGIDSNYIDTSVTAANYEYLEKLNDIAYDGKADLSKLDSGEEVFLIAPKKAEVIGFAHNRTMGVDINCDKDIGKRNVHYESILTAESNYKSGDIITIDITAENYDEKNNTFTVETEKSKVKIAAIISPNDIEDMHIGIYNSFGIVTSKNGFEKIAKNLGYESLYAYTEFETDDELDRQIRDELEVYAQKYGGYIDSNYSYNQFQKNQYYMLLAAIISIIIICFVICAGVINNSISARIRENKRVIGTLRAVGASKSDLIKSYIIEMLSMFSWGTATGFAVYFAGFLISIIIQKFYSSDMAALTFSPWITIGMTILLFAVCSVNLWIKIKKEMKNSIIENIREL